MWKLFDSTIDRISALLFALFFMQAPSFFLQYLQHLSGSVAELKAIVATMEATARHHGKTLSAYISKFIAHSDLEISEQGSVMLGITERLANLQQAELALQNSSPFLKPLHFARYFDYSVAKGTLSQFQPALTLSVESVLWGLTGLFMGLLFYAAIKRGALQLRRIW